MWKKDFAHDRVRRVILVAATPRPLADMVIPVPNAKAISLKAYRGKVLLVAVISTDCGLHRNY